MIPFISVLKTFNLFFACVHNRHSCPLSFSTRCLTLTHHPPPPMCQVLSSPLSHFSDVTLRLALHTPDRLLRSLLFASFDRVFHLLPVSSVSSVAYLSVSCCRALTILVLPLLFFLLFYYCYLWMWLL